MKMNAKNIAIAATAALMLMPAAAVAEPSPHETCTEAARLAEGIMELRQEGVAMSLLMDVAAETGGEWRGLTEAMVIDAYGQPRFSTEEFQQNAIRDFANDAYRACITELR